MVISFNIIPLPVCLAERNSSLLPELIKKRRESSGPCRPLPVCPFGPGPRQCRPGSCASVPRDRVRKAPCAPETGPGRRGRRLTRTSDVDAAGRGPGGRGPGTTPEQIGKEGWREGRGKDGE